MKTVSIDHRVHQTFATYDRNNDGLITSYETRTANAADKWVLQQATPRGHYDIKKGELASYLATYDANRDGMLSAAEQQTLTETMAQDLRMRERSNWGSGGMVIGALAGGFVGGVVGLTAGIAGGTLLTMGLGLLAGYAVGGAIGGTLGYGAGIGLWHAKEGVKELIGPDNNVLKKLS
jgi:hypothetical protein